MSRVLRPEDVLRLQFVRDGRIAPDGKRVAYQISGTDAGSQQDVSRIEIHALDSGRSTRLSKGSLASYPRWTPDSTRVAYVDARDDSNRLTVAQLQDGSERFFEVPGAGIQGPPAWSPDGRTIAVVVAIRRPHSAAIHRIASRDFRADGVGFTDAICQRLCVIDVADGTCSVLVDDSGFYSHLEWDDAGERILYVRIDSPIPGAGYSSKLCSVRVRDRAVRQHLGEGWYIATARWVPGGRHIAVIGARGSHLTIPTTDLWVVDCDGTEASCRSEAVAGRVGFRLHHDMPIWDAIGLEGLAIKDADSGWVSVQQGGRVGIYEMSLTGAPRCEPVIGGERACLLLNACPRTGQFVFLATDVLTPSDLHLFQAGRETRLTAVNRDVLAEWPVMHVTPLRFSSVDGLELEGWFLAEASRTGPLPAVMFIHGGPFIATGHAFRFDFHLLAAHGVGVLFANFRGSFGYGEPFAASIMGDWGARGFPDHVAAVDCAVGRGLADPARLGVWGASHGGFATAWIVGHTNRFRAAVAEAAVTNLLTAYYLSDGPQIFERDLGGKPHEIPDVYRSRSPLTYAHRCTTPTLLLHGEDDLRCPIAEAEQFHRALLDAGCVAELVRLRDANHMGDSSGPPHARVGQNSALLDWFERFL